ncbi:hypothetical protein [Paenibacillus sp. y28]|uniref:hypothetical protein n=1 Tax=Paenibacillus sp. y28 TaxID=3129110 RepID=UPI00301AF0B2
MKKSRVFPFERNRYFYGKLLTVRDFESEQKYFNDKRRLLNRVLYGSGVLAGLQVVRVNDKTVTVEMGLALDGLGREIVVASPITLKLSMVEGFTNNDYAKNVYLCIAYDEKGKEPVHSVAGRSVRSEEVSEYNRLAEGYRLFVREEAPDPSSFEWNELLEHTAVVYQDDHVRILQTVPRFVRPGETFHLTLKVEKTIQTPVITFEYEPESDALQLVSKDGEGILRFVEPGDSRSSEFVQTYPVHVVRNTAQGAYFRAKTGTIRLQLGDREIAVSPNFASKVEIVEESVQERLVGAYFQRTLDQSIDSGSEPCVYLARISLLQMGPTYMIEQVDCLPFGERIVNNPLLQRLLLQKEGTGSSLPFAADAAARLLESDEKPQLSVAYDPEQHKFDFTLGLPEPRSTSEDVRTGVVELPIQSPPKPGLISFAKMEKSFFSAEIAHGLGDGQVLLTVGMEDAGADPISELSARHGSVYYGDEDVFAGSEYDPGLPAVSIGTVVYPNRGTFRIGVKLKQTTELTSLRLRWWAVRPSEAAGGQQAGQASSVSGATNREAAAAKDEL